MEQQQGQASIVLKYEKRRYDGGSEIELIRMIERERAIAKMQRMNHPHMNVSPSVALASETAPPALQSGAKSGNFTPENASQAPVTHSRFQQALGALLMGPILILVGILGLLASAIALTICNWTHNLPLQQQARQVRHECLQGFKMGVGQILSIPANLFKIARATA